MTAKISDELLSLCNAADAEGIDEEISVLVTVKPDTPSSVLATAGLKIENRFMRINTVAGRIALSKVQALSKLDESIEIDVDGEVWTAG